MRTSYYSYASLVALVFCFLPGVADALPPGLLYLSETHSVRSRALGGIALSPGGERSPEDAASEPGWRMSTLRVPRARVEVLTPSPEGGSSTAATLTRDGYALAQLSRPMRLGDSTSAVAELAYRAAGRFERVNSDGKSVHAFPNVDMAVGLGLSRRLSSTLSLNGAARWLRSKYPDSAAESRTGSGWAFDVGVAVRPATRWAVALTARNLSNGVSYPDLRRPRDPRHEVSLAVGRSVRLSDAAELTILVDARTPSRRGTQGSTGAALQVRDRFGVGVGYMRRVERLVSTAVRVASASDSDTRLWRALGPTAGAWLRVGGVELGAAVGPAYLPLSYGDETHAIHNGRWQWSLGVGPARGAAD